MMTILYVKRDLCYKYEKSYIKHKIRSIYCQIFPPMCMCISKDFLFIRVYIVFRDFPQVKVTDTLW